MVWAGLIKIPLKISFYTEIINHSSSKKSWGPFASAIKNRGRRRGHYI